jgi:membrane fusion protein, copper/silver efflux system
MKMEPVYAEERAQTGVPNGSSVRPAGTVKINLDQQQMIGVHLGTVQTQTARHNLRLLGKVAVEENRLYRVVANVNGMIMKTCPYAPGSRIAKEESFATMFSPEFSSAIQSLLASLAAQDRVQALGQQGAAQGDPIAYYGNNLQQNLDNLKYLGLGEAQVDEIVRTRKLARNIDITSPADGIILHWNITPGLRFDKGTELVRLADLSKVWILADLFENETEDIRPGMTVSVKLASPPRTLIAQLSELVPQFDGVSRTIKLRLEVENQDLALKPDMFVEVEVPVSLPEGIVVPREAVLDSGQRQTVYVHQGDGFFEPRVVTTGRHLGDEIEIRQGLEAGEEIVLSGNFLLDSESRMKLAAGGAAVASAGAGAEREPATRDPVCGMSITAPADQATRPHSDYHSRMYYFCAEGCKRKFDENPAAFAAKTVKARGDTLGMASPDAARNP